MANEHLPVEPIPRAVLQDRRDAARSILKDNYQGRIDLMKVSIREAAQKIGGDLMNGFFALSDAQDWSVTESICWNAALLECLEAAEQAGFEARQEEAKATPEKTPKRGPAAPHWAEALGKGGTRLTLPSPMEEGAWTRWLRASPPRHHGDVMQGACEIDFALCSEFIDREKFIFGDYLVFGWLVEKKTVPKGTLDSEIEKRVREIKANSGMLTRTERLSIKEDAKSELLKQAIPSRTIYPIVVHMAEAWMIVNGPQSVVEALRAALAGGTAESVFKLANESQRDSLGLIVGTTDLRNEEGIIAPHSDTLTGLPPTVGAIADFLLWVLLTCKENALASGLTDLEWAADRVDFAKDGDGIKLDGTDTGAMHAALAEGHQVVSLRLRLTEVLERIEATDDHEASRVERNFFLTLERRDEALVLKATGLPGSKIYGDVEGTIAERVLLFNRLTMIVQAMAAQYAEIRCFDAWQKVVNAGRQWVGLELMRRFAFDAGTGQGWLFKPQAILPTIEAPKSRRNRRAPK